MEVGGRKREGKVEGVDRGAMEDLEALKGGWEVIAVMKEWGGCGEGGWESGRRVRGRRGWERRSRAARREAGWRGER